MDIRDKCQGTVSALMTIAYSITHLKLCTYDLGRVQVA